MKDARGAEEEEAHGSRYAVVVEMRQVTEPQAGKAPGLNLRVFAGSRDEYEKRRRPRDA